MSKSRQIVRGTQPNTRSTTQIHALRMESTTLAGPNGRARGFVSCRVSTQVNREPRIAHAVCAGECNQGARCAATASSDSHLTASQIKLRLSGDVKTDVLGANEVVARREIPWNCYAERIWPWSGC